VSAAAIWPRPVTWHVAETMCVSIRSRAPLRKPFLLEVELQLRLLADCCLETRYLRESYHVASFNESSGADDTSLKRCLNVLRVAELLWQKTVKKKARSRARSSQLCSNQLSNLSSTPSRALPPELKFLRHNGRTAIPEERTVFSSYQASYQVS
jgi:hypothetical protein